MKDIVWQTRKPNYKCCNHTTGKWAPMKEKQDDETFLGWVWVCEHPDCDYTPKPL